MARTITLADIRSNPVYSYLIKDMPFSTRVLNACLNDGIYYLGELIQLTELEIFGRPNMGKMTLAELGAIYKELGVDFGTQIKDEMSPAALRTELEAIRKEREKGLTELQRISAPDIVYTPYNHWLTLAGELLTPIILDEIQDARERRIIEGRRQKPPRTYEELGGDFGITRERIRQIERRTIGFMKKRIRLGIISQS